MRITDEYGKTTHVVFNYEENRLHDDQITKTIKKTLIYGLRKPGFQIRKLGDRHIKFTGTIGPEDGYFLEHLIRQRGVLASNGYLSYALNPNPLVES